MGRRFETMSCTENLLRNFFQESMQLSGKSLNHNQDGPIKVSVNNLYLEAS